jgi:N-methylhydantoinase A
VTPTRPLPVTNVPVLRIGIDIGGTFTDFVIFHPQTGQVETFKLLSTPHDPAEVVLDGLSSLGISPSVRQEIVHGSTVATNALLERKGAHTTLVTTQGFRDLLQIGRQNRTELYNLAYQPIPPLIPPELRFEVSERVDHTGQVLVPLDPAQVDQLIPVFREQGIESVAVCLLFSFLLPAHEEVIASRLREAGFFVSVSCEIIPEYREYERTSTTAINAYVSPILDRYLSHLEGALPAASRGRGSSLRIMQSNGGMISLSEARRFGARCILSGPAGGVIGARYVGEKAVQAADSAAMLQLITFDMGGTSTDVSLIAGEPLITTEAQVSGLPIRLPILDIQTIGAGGGSIAAVDAGGALRVGPQSAGADPGPACYSPEPPGVQPEQAFPTVTDANLVLGRLQPDQFLGGAMPLNLARAYWVMQRLGASLGLDPTQAALGVIEVVNAHMERLLRLISVERGYDPADFILLSFGGAGGLHACDLARRMGIPQVLIPPLASVLSAFGMLAANVVKDYSQTVMLPGNVPPAKISALLAMFETSARRDLLAEGVPPQAVELLPLLDMRYRGQSYELTIHWQHPNEDFLAAFHTAHHTAYGYSLPAVPVEIVNLRLHAVGKMEPIPLPAHPPAGPDPQPALIGYESVFFSNRIAQSIPVYRGKALLPGNQLAGPALVVRSDTTILLGENDTGWVDPFLNLNINISRESISGDMISRDPKNGRASLPGDKYL